MSNSFFKKKKFFTIIVILLAVVLFSYRQYKKSHQPPPYETVAVRRGDLVQTVDATGKIESTNEVALRFEVPGTISQVRVKEGDAVKQGTYLANLRLGELNAAVAQANANLQQKLAGATAEERKFYSAALDAAKAAWDQSKVDADAAVKTAQSAIETAKNNLKIAEGGENSQIVIQAYEDTVATLPASLAKLDDALTQADNILGIDNSLANDTFHQYLATLDSNTLNRANTLYLDTKENRAKARAATIALTTQSSHALIDAALSLVEQALASANQLLLSVAEVLKSTPPVGTLTQATLDTKKTIIESARANIASQYTMAINQKQALADAGNSLNIFTIAYNKALQDLDNAKANAITSVKIKEAAYQQAAANYQSKINPPRAVDVAAYRAALDQAIASRDKAILRAPIDGVITKVGKKNGEAVAGADIIITMLSPHYEVKVDIPETDVAKLKLNDPADINLDALGADSKLSGSVLAIDPGSTEVQDVVYYKVTVGLVVSTSSPTSSLSIKPGMTANVSIKTNSRQNVLFLPVRTVRSREDGAKFIRLLEAGKEKEVPVKTGLKANDALIEIIEGVTPGQQVIIGAK